jgi:hypothetical protein
MSYYVQYFQLLKFFLLILLFLFFSSEQLCYQNKRYSKKISEFFADPTFLVSSYIIKTGGIEKRVCEYFADPSVSQTCAPQPLEPSSFHLYLWGFLKEKVHKQQLHTS